LTTVTVTTGQLVTLATSISTAWNAVQGVLSAFKTTSKDTLLQTMTDQGYKTFMDKTSVNVVQEIPDKYWSTFISHMSSNLLIPPSQLLAFQNYVMDIQYVGNDTWSALDLSFSEPTGAECHYLLITTAKNEINHTHSWVHANVQAAFTLAPNIMVISHEKSSFFSDKVTLELREVPAGLKLSDIQGVFSLLRVIALKSIGDMIHLELPLK
jgi:glycine cleavage system regulatory protein